jgi:hypothetical protein
MAAALTPSPRAWMPPELPVNEDQLELAGCEAVEVGPIVAALVTYWTDKAETATGDAGDFYLKAKRSGERLLVSMGWRFLPVDANLDPAQLPHPSGQFDCGRFAAFPRELRRGDTLILPSFTGRPGYLWRPAVLGTTHRRRRKKRGYYVEVSGGVTLQFEEDDAIVIERSRR